MRISGRTARSANEVHIPVGRAVKIKFESSDPIQGLWIPGLMSRRARATDHDKEVQLVAERADIYRSQCLELAKCPPARRPPEPGVRNVACAADQARTAPQGIRA